MLSNFQLGSHPLLQIFLLGQPEFRLAVQATPGLEQLRQRIIATHHLGAMDAHEVQPYIEHRLKLVGWQDRPSFTADVWPRLFAQTGGIPRRVNMLINRVLLMASVENRDAIDGALVDAVLADLAVDMVAEDDWQNEAVLASAVSHAAAAPAASPPDSASQQAVAPQTTSAMPLADVAATAAGVSAADFDAFVQEVQLFAGQEEDARAGLTRELQVALDRVQALEARAATPADLESALARIQVLEEQQADQQKALHRVLALLVGWVEDESAGIWPRGRAA